MYNEADLAAFELCPLTPACSALDLIELDGRDLRWLQIEQRKRTLAKAVRGAGHRAQ